MTAAITSSLRRSGAGLRLALSWLTILPVGASEAPRPVAARAIGLAPVVGAGVGAAAAGLGVGLRLLGSPWPLTGLLVVGFLAAVTRGMHVDGLADTADALGCYGPGDRALEVMRSGSAGPFAVVTLLVVLGAQAVTIGTMVTASTGHVNGWPAVVIAVACGRAAFSWCCRRGHPAARPEGLGALVAGSQPVAVPVVWGAVLAVVAAFALPSPWWRGPVAIAVAAAVIVVLSWHTGRRFGGVTGDVLGAASELATTTVLVVCSLR